MAAVERSWRLRPATRDDREFLFQLHHEALGEYIAATWGWEEDYQRRYFDERFEDRQARTRVIVVDGVDAGVLETEQRDDELYVGLLELAPSFQGQGVGAEVMRGLLDEGRPVSLHVLRANPRARRFYESLGFRVVEELDVKMLMRFQP